MSTTQPPRGQKPAQPIRGRQRKEKPKNKKLSHSSRTWVNRQLNDPYVIAAKAAGYRSRAAFKLIQMDEKCELLRPGMVVVDLGAAPGGWSQVAAAKLGGNGKIIAMDILDMPAVPGVTFFQADFTDEAAQKTLLAELHGRRVDLVMSDIAPNTIGHPRTDHLRIMATAEMALDFACEVLAPGGAFVCKFIQGGASGDLLKPLRANFEKVRNVKPPASRSDSAEMYIVATGFKPRA